MNQNNKPEIVVSLTLILVGITVFFSPDNLDTVVRLADVAIAGYLGYILPSITSDQQSRTKEKLENEEATKKKANNVLNR